MKYLLVLLILLSSCAYQTAVVSCGDRTDIDMCIRQQLGKDVKIVNKERIDNNTYLVDYR